MAAAADGNTHWATQESQWEAHRETIGWLYCKQDKTLAEVMEIMRREHGFRASIKMYKYRISKWGMRKYLKADEARSFIRRIKMGHDTELPTIQGRQLGSKALKAKAEHASQLQHVIRQRILRQGLNGRVEAPDMLHALENALFFARTNISQSMNYGQSSYPVAGVQESWGEIDRAAAWWAKMQSAVSQLKERRDSASGFAALNSCFAQYAAQLTTGSFATDWSTYNSILLMYEIGEDLGRLFGRYVVNLSSIRCGESHPNTRRWAEMLKFDANIRSEAFASLMHADFSMAQKYAPPKSAFWMTIAVLCLGYSCGEGLISPEIGVSYLDEVVGHEAVKSDKQQSARHYSLCATTSVTAALQSAYLGTSLSWADTPLQLLLHLAQTNPSIPREQIVGVLYFISALMGCTNKASSAERYLIAARDILQLETPDDHYRIEQVCSKLESMRLRRGDDKGAEAARVFHSGSTAASQGALDRNVLADQPVTSIQPGLPVHHPSDGEGHPNKTYTELKSEGSYEP